MSNAIQLVTAIIGLAAAIFGAAKVSRLQHRDGPASDLLRVVTVFVTIALIFLVPYLPVLLVSLVTRTVADMNRSDKPSVSTPRTPITSIDSLAHTIRPDHAALFLAVRAALNATGIPREDMLDSLSLRSVRANELQLAIAAASNMNVGNPTRDEALERIASAYMRRRDYRMAEDVAALIDGELRRNELTGAIVDTVLLVGFHPAVIKTPERP